MWLKRVDGRGGEGVGNDLALAGMFAAVADVEDAWDARDESLVEVTERSQD